MIPLRGKILEQFHLANDFPRVFRIESGGVDGNHLRLVNDVKQHSEVALLFDGSSPDLSLGQSYVRLPAEFRYLKPGDIIDLWPRQKRFTVEYRSGDSVNSLLVTERCDNYCLMCSQPPREIEDSARMDTALEVIELIREDAPNVGITGGEPTLYGARFIDLVRTFFGHHPHGSLHVLSNGKRFADSHFAADYAGVAKGDSMMGIPLYGAEAYLHDHIVQSRGAFGATVKGIVNLAEYGAAVEIRVVLQRNNIGGLEELARFVSRNLPFVDHVALMGLEMMGFARANFSEVWIDPVDYGQELTRAVKHLDSSGINVSIYNLPLCLLPREIRGFAVRSISDWKNEFDEECSRCDLSSQCSGFFTSAKYAGSRGVRPLNLDGDFLDDDESSDTVDRQIVLEEPKWRRRVISLGVPVSKDGMPS